MPGFGKSGTSRTSLLKFSIDRFLPFYSERRILGSGLKHDLFHIVNAGKTRAGCQVVLESLDGLFASLRERLNAAVPKVAHIAADLVTRGRPLRKVPEPDPLHETAEI